MSEADDLDRARGLTAIRLAANALPTALPTKMPEDLRDAILAAHDVHAFGTVQNMAARNRYLLCVTCLEALTSSDYLFNRACCQTGLSLCSVCFRAIYRQSIRDWKLAQLRVASREFRSRTTKR